MKRQHDIDYAHAPIKRSLYEIARRVARSRGMKAQALCSEIFEAGMKVKRIDVNERATGKMRSIKNSDQCVGNDKS